MNVDCLLKSKYLGGVREVGANSTYININNTGIIIDAGLHPTKRDKDAFPKYELLENEPVDFLIITHAHTDHIGALPYLIKMYPHIKIFAHKATSYLLDVMIRDTVKILQTQISTEFSDEILSLYNRDILEKINQIIDELQFYDEKVILGKRGDSDIILKLYPAGHILGASAIYLESDGMNLLHTGDLNLMKQPLIEKGDLPKHHLDILITESTNCNTNEEIGFSESNIKRFAKFINDISNENGSILIPTFSLGKTQELLTLVHNLQYSGKITNIPIYTGGLGTSISQIYDRFCYTTPRIKPGFELNDIQTIPILKDELLKGKYLKSPGIVIISNGMMHPKTSSYTLASEWIKRKEFGILFTGYLQENTPAYQILNSEINKTFNFDGRNLKRQCKTEFIRLSLHCNCELLTNYINDIQPKNIIIVHGDEEANDNLALKLYSSNNKYNILIPYNNENLTFDKKK